MFMWQSRQLNPPPVLTLLHDVDADITSVLKDARHVLEEGVKVTEVHKSLSSEIFIVKKISYKSNSSLHNEKALQGLRQLERSLRRLVELSPTSLMKSLHDNWPSVLNLYHGAVVYLPTRQMLEFVLVRVVGCAALLHQIINRAVLTYTAAMDQLAIGMQTKNMLVFAAAASRVWYLCRSMKVQLCASYSRLLPLVDILKPTNAVWLKDGFKFPIDLGTWLGKELGMPSANMDSKRMPSGHVQSGNKEETNSHKDVSDSTTTTQVVAATSKVSTLLMEDVGEAVKRDTVPKCTKKQSMQAHISVDPPISHPKSSNIGTTGTPQKVDVETLFSLSSWFEEIDKCNTKQEMGQVMASFQKKFQLKSKRIKDCCRDLKAGMGKEPCKKADKKGLKACLKKVAKMHAGKMMMGESGRQQITQIEESKEQTDQSSLGNEVLESTQNVNTETESFGPTFVRVLKLKMLRPNGVKETLGEVNEGRITAGATSWEIPAKTVPRLKKVLRECLKNVKGVAKLEKKLIIVKTVKHVKTALAGFDKDKGSLKTLEAEDSSSKNLSMEQKGKAKKGSKKSRTKEDLATDDKESKKVAVKQAMMKNEIGDHFPKGKKAKKPKKNKQLQQETSASKPSFQRKALHQSDSNNNRKAKSKQRNKKRKGTP